MKTDIASLNVTFIAILITFLLALFGFASPKDSGRRRLLLTSCVVLIAIAAVFNLAGSFPPATATTTDTAATPTAFPAPTPTPAPIPTPTPTPTPDPTPTPGPVPSPPSRAEVPFAVTMEANGDASSVTLAGPNVFLTNRFGKASVSARAVSVDGKADSSSCTIDIVVVNADSGEQVDPGFEGRCRVNTNDYLPPGRYRYEGQAYYAPTEETAPVSWEFEVR